MLFNNNSIQSSLQIPFKIFNRLAPLSNAFFTSLLSLTPGLILHCVRIKKRLGVLFIDFFNVH